MDHGREINMMRSERVYKNGWEHFGGGRDRQGLILELVLLVQATNMSGELQ